MIAAAVIEGDCLEQLAGLPDASVDAVVTDPPYGLEFMGKDWDRLGATAEAFRESLNVNGEVDYHGKGNAPFGGGGNRIRYGSTARAMQEWHESWAREALRVLKPGGHLLAFGGTRTYHRLACAVEDAGFEVRETIAWLYGSGFPKSLDVSKAIDRAAGADREKVPATGGLHSNRNLNDDGWSKIGADSPEMDGPTPATPDAERWQGWGSALKPAHEPIVVARKPLVGTVAQNCLEHGTGALNVDGCRIATDPDRTGTGFLDGSTHDGDRRSAAPPPAGRWPANVVLSHKGPEPCDLCDGEGRIALINDAHVQCNACSGTGEIPGCKQTGTRRVKSNAPARYIENGAEAVLYGDGPGKREPGDERPGYADADGLETVPAWSCEPDCPVRLLDEQSGPRMHGAGFATTASPNGARNDFDPTSYGHGGTSGRVGDSGGASRFFPAFEHQDEPRFRYVAKASSAERGAGLDCEGVIEGAWKNTHPLEPTVKPIDLMRWLVRLVTPPGGLVLDPFAGSGTTGIACGLEGLRFLGIERDPEYVKIARARLAWWAQRDTGDTAAVLASLRDAPAEQLELAT